jgi:hypothetical protein
MNKAFLGQQASTVLSGKEFRLWRAAQTLLFIIGLTLVALLFFQPRLGLTLFWDVLIPIAPALFVFAAGIWRNICPLGTTSLLPLHFNFSKRKRLSLHQQGKLQLTGVILLFLLIPLRHLGLNLDGILTGSFLVLTGLTAFLFGSIYEWKSSWCAGLCPVHPVEKFYGSNTVVTPKNAHCGTCKNCVLPCPDSHQKLNNELNNRPLQRFAERLLFGGFPGFIWAWFHVKDFHFLNLGFQEGLIAYFIPFTGMAFSFLVFCLLLKYEFLEEKTLIRIFGAASVSTYYWYRIPALLGFGLFPGDGQLFDLSGVILPQVMVGIQILSLSFFTYWMIIRPSNSKQWMYRPPFKPN